MHYTYIVRCADGTLYTGWTTDLNRRMAAHNAGEGAKYTRSRRPVTLIYHECFATKEEALRRECAIKRLSRQEKLRLIAERGEPEQKETTGKQGSSAAVCTKTPAAADLIR